MKVHDTWIPKQRYLTPCTGPQINRHYEVEIITALFVTRMLRDEVYNPCAKPGPTYVILLVSNPEGCERTSCNSQMVLSIFLFYMATSNLQVNLSDLFLPLAFVVQELPMCWKGANQLIIQPRENVGSSGASVRFWLLNWVTSSYLWVIR